MKIELEVTAQEYRAVHDLIGYVLRPRAIEDDPDTRPLRSFYAKWAKLRDEARCNDCKRKVTYAKGLCRACYQRARRAS